MKVGDLVINLYTKEIGIITDGKDGGDYVIVDDRWNVPVDHLEVLNESR